MKIAMIGAGNVGQALGRNWAQSGHEVTYGVRDPADAKHQALAPQRVADLAAAAQGADVIVLATAWNGTEAAIKALGPLAGRIVIDCTNPLAFTPGQGLSLALGFDRSGGEMVAQWAPGAIVVKTLNQTGAEVMADPRRFPQAPVMFVASDDHEAKAKVISLVADLGFAARDGGPLKNARLLEPYAMVWIDQALVRGAGRDMAMIFSTPR